jgi:ketosteroid isomerase-like protein
VARSSDANREAVKKANLAWERGDSELLLEAMHPDVEWTNEGRRIEAETFRGLDELREAYRTWVGTWSTYEARFGEPMDIGDGRFYVPFWERARGKGSGADVESASAVIVEASDGRVVRMHSYIDPAEARAAAGLPPEAD